MNCMMKQCAHTAPIGVVSACQLLGECGCLYALERSRAVGGYEVHTSSNKTIQALRSAGLVTLINIDGRTGIAQSTSAKDKAD